MSNIVASPQEGASPGRRRPALSDGTQSAVDADAVCAQMTHRATLRIAAGVLAESNFPQPGHLPRVAALPFVNLGHIPLLDHDLLSRVLWEAASQLDELYRQWRKKRRLAEIIAVAVAALVWLFLGLIPAFVAFLVTRALVRSRRRFDEKAADLRRELVSSLHAGQVPNVPDVPVPTESRIAWANGRIGFENAPVLVAAGGRRFPGFGREQGIETLVCPPDMESREHRLADRFDVTRVYDAVLQAAKASGLPHLRAGHAVVIEAGALAAGSRFLDRSQCPRLWISASELAEVEGWGPGARVHFAVQVLLPEQGTSATLFVRAFPAGDAAAVEFSLSTLGPPSFTDAGLRERLRELSSHHRRKHFKRYWSRRFWRDLRRMFARTRHEATPFARLFQRLTEERMKVVLPSVEGLRSLFEKHPASPLDDEEQRDLGYEAGEYRQESTSWPGNWSAIANWREWYAFALPEGAFEGAETRAAIRAFYERVGSHILDTLKAMGYDITKYRDSEGRLNIHAEAIDKLVVGEKVFVDREADGSRKSKKKAKKSA